MKDLKKIFVLFIIIFLSGNLKSFSQTYDELVDAIIKKEEKKVWYYIKAQANVNEKDINGVTPIMYAAETGNIYIINLLIKSGADINAVPDSKITALIAATKSNNPEIVEILIKNGAKINVVDNLGNTPLMYCAAYGFPLTAWTLCNYGADVNEENNGDNAMTIAAYYGDTEIMKILLDFGASINFKDNLGFSPLMIASQNNMTDAVKFLIENNADIESENTQNHTALEIASYYGNKESVKILLEKGALCRKKENNAIELAQINGNKETINLLSQKFELKKNTGIPNMHSIGINYELGFFDFMKGSNYTYTLSKLKADIQGTILLRPYKKKILIQESENLYYQYRESKFISGISIQKKIPLNKEGAGKKGIFIGVCEYFALSGYKGIEKNHTEFIFAPEAGLYFKNSKSSVKLSYKYMSYNNTSDNIASRLNLSFSFFLNKKISFFQKEIYGF